MSMGSLKTLAEDHHCHDILLESSILTDRGQWHANPKSNSDFSPDLGSKSDATAASDKNQSPQSTRGLGMTMATDLPTFPSESSKASGEGSTSPSLSSSEEVDLARSELSHGDELCQLDPVPGCLKETVSGTDNMSPSHVLVNNAARPVQPGDAGDHGGDVTTGQRDQRGEGVGGEKSCPPIRRDVSQEITILVTSHDTCVGDEQDEEEEEEREEREEENERAGELERASSLKNIQVEEMRTPSQDAMAPAGREGPVEGCIVVASLTSTSEVERPQIVGSNCLETGKLCNAQCKDTKVTGGKQESPEPISNNSSGCVLETQSEAKQSTETNSSLAGGLSTDLSSQCSAKPIPTESEPSGPGNTTSNKNVGQPPTRNKSCVGDSRERLQKAKTLDLSSGRFSASPGKTATVQGQSSLEVVVCHSVATSPMTPPEGSAAFLFPYSSAGGANGDIEGKKEFRSVATAPMSPQNLTAPEALPDIRTAEVEKRSVATAPMSPQNLTAPEALPDVRTAGVEMRSVATAPMSPQNLTAPETIPDTRTAGVEMRSVATAPMSPQNLTAPEHIPDAYTAGAEMKSVATAPMSPQNLTAPESIPDIRKIGSVQTQKSLEVMCHSVATSPMTPPGGSAAFLFPQPKEIKLRSVATAPMSPQGLIAPEAIPETCLADQEEPTSPEIIPEPRAHEPCNAPPEPPEPVQDVSWDEKGMTWDVYGAVVEVTVLGTAIQKHLEKQVQKQRKQTSSDTDSPAKSQAPDQSLTQFQSPSQAQSSVDGASAAAATGPALAGSQKKRHPKEEKNVGVKRKGRRKNLLRGRFRRLQWPSCCSRSRPEEAP